MLCIQELFCVASIHQMCIRDSFGTNKRHIQAYKDMLAPLGLGLEDKLGIPVGSLSGGQRQALALLMATMTPIDFLILDEHLSLIHI